MFDNKLFITICGTIGTGKSTLTRKLVEKLGWEGFIEDITDNKSFPYLTDFFTDKKRWVMNNQLSFLINKVEQHLNVESLKKSACQDVGVYECHNVFTRSLYTLGIIDERDFSVLGRAFDLFWRILRKPDLVILLEASLDVLKYRINERGEFVDGVTSDLLAELDRTYKSFAKSRHSFPVLALNSEKINFRDNPTDLDYVIEEIFRTIQR